MKATNLNNKKATLVAVQKCSRNNEGQRESTADSVNQRFTCDVCKKYFRSKQWLRIHMEKHLNEDHPDSEQCGVCKKFILNEKFEEHFKQQHKRIECEDCDKVYFNKRAFKKHKQTHEVPYTCDHCNRKFAFKKLLEKHILVVHLGIKFRSKCELCGKMISSINFKSHIQTVHLKQRKFVCDVCHRAYSFAKNLRDHLAIVHLNQKNHFCTICNKNFMCKSSLKFHMKTLHGGKPKIKCEKCQRSFAHSCNYRVHLKGHETKPFSCTHLTCKLMFKTKKALDKHVKDCHNKPKPYGLIEHNCEQCNKTYMSRNGLKLHISKVHLGMLYHCDNCGKKFTQKENIKRHLLKQHIDKS